MSKIIVAYWSQSGNTQAIAEAIGEGVVLAGKEVLVTEISKISPVDLKAEDRFALGCPSMGSEELEESEMEPFVRDVEMFAAGKKILLFGSYGWGDGQWMREWEDRMGSAGAVIVDGEGYIVKESPGKDEIKKAIELGKSLAML